MTTQPPAPQARGETRKRRTVIEPAHPFEGLGLRACAEYADLLWAFALRDVRLRYRQTALGVAWVLLQPLLGAGLFAFVFGKVARLDSEGRPYFLFSYAGLLAWMVFSNTVTKANMSLLQNSAVITKVYFPRILLPLSSLLASLLDLAIALALMLVLLAVAKVGLTVRVLLLPIWVLMLLALALGCGLIGGALSVKYRDVPYITPVLMQFLTYASPVAYAMSAVPAQWRRWLWLNPLSSLIEASRWSLLGVGSFNPRALGYSAAVIVVLLAVGARVFNHLESTFADVI